MFSIRCALIVNYTRRRALGRDLSSKNRAVRMAIWAARRLSVRTGCAYDLEKRASLGLRFRRHSVATPGKSILKTDQ